MLSQAYPATLFDRLFCVAQICLKPLPNFRVGRVLPEETLQGICRRDIGFYHLPHVFKVFVPARLKFVEGQIERIEAPADCSRRCGDRNHPLLPSLWRSHHGPRSNPFDVKAVFEFKLAPLPEMLVDQFVLLSAFSKAWEKVDVGRNRQVTWRGGLGTKDRHAPDNDKLAVSRQVRALVERQNQVISRKRFQ